ncbi:unnamed protein product [Spirodela intermedia]|uniref:Uncharacterized protein n=1 Tax=Spirodela intermedia TaxID=51605 RepID=A0A7I8J7C2_SPIIN|nr:unnamed protein product [Spirodela intermedia]CAA6666117.1 unnamed protein product [Spirodela intermedia]
MDALIPQLSLSKFLRHSEASAAQQLQQQQQTNGPEAARGSRRAAGEKAGNGEGGSSSSGGDAAAWPSFRISWTFKGAKLPQRPKKRPKCLQRILNSGDVAGDVSLERYEVREKKTSKKKPRGLKAMESVQSESE